MYNYRLTLCENYILQNRAGAAVSRARPCFQLHPDEEARYQISGPNSWKGKRRKNFDLEKSLRYHRKSRDLP